MVAKRDRSSATDVEPTTSGVQASPGGHGAGSESATPASTGTVPVVRQRWRLSNWRLRRKLVAVLLVPALATLLFAGLAVRSEISDINHYNALSDEVALSAQASAVVDALQKERDLAMIFSANGKSLGGEDYNLAADASDAQVTLFRSQASQDSDLSAGVQSAFDVSENSLSGLDVLRQSIQSTNYPATAALIQYNNMIASVLQIDRAVSSDATGAGAIASAVSLFGNAKEDIAQEDSVLLIMVAPNGSSPALANDLLNEQSAYASDIAAFDGVATADQQQQVQDVISGPDVDNRARFAQTALAESTANVPLSVRTQDIQPAATNTVGLYRKVETSLFSQSQSALNSLKSAAQRSVITNIIIVVAILLVALAIMLLVSAAMLAPLRSLRTNALEVARVRLPAAIGRILASENPIEASRESVDPVPPFTHEEVGEVARSFDVVHGQAVRLAAEQAVLRDNVNAIFVNLARRSQVLVERQLSLIDRLERDEQDPDQLANLFELDHLATRMRRNSESLLVLSGSGLAKRMSQAVPIGDLVGAAVSEVEQYARIEVGVPPNAQIFGRVVNDLIHLIAELLDNATVFSEPNTKVSVRIAKTRAREVAIQITDRGVGMSEEDVRDANERLANPPELDVSVTRRMGLYVVARLAKRHNIRVKLRTNEDIDGGTVALVVIGEDLIYQPGIEGQPQQPTGERPLPAAPARAEAAPAGAVAAAGIAGAFGMSRSRVENTEAPSAPPVGAQLGGGSLDQARVEQEDPLNPATSFWSSDLALNEPDSFGGQPAPSPEPVPSTQQTQTQFLWEPHTAPEDLPAISEASDSGIGDRLDGVPLPAARSGPARGAGGAALEADAPTERLPIYEAVLSQWFRPEDAARSDVLGGPESTSAAVTPVSVPVPPVEPAPVEESKPLSNGGLPTRVPGKAGAAAGFGIARKPATDTGSTSAWETPADEGWQLAEALLSPVSEVTGAGLPKRVPKAHLVPGSAAPRPANPQQADAPPLPPRSAEAVRGRMSSFQRGVRRGRHALIEAYSGGASPHSDGSHDEEHE